MNSPTSHPAPSADLFVAVSAERLVVELLRPERNRLVLDVPFPQGLPSAIPLDHLVRAVGSLAPTRLLFAPLSAPARSVWEPVVVTLRRASLQAGIELVLLPDLGSLLETFTTPPVRAWSEARPHPLVRLWRRGVRRLLSRI